MPKYLYNGVELPALPDWDKTIFPYAYIWTIDSMFPGSTPSNYKLTIRQAPLRYGTVDGSQSIYGDAGTTAMYNCNLTDGEFKTWEYYGENVSDKSNSADPIWTNHNVYSDTDGTLYLAASEPVPVHVTESKGDGYALYNGVKLPNIDTVWTDKETYPYAVVINMYTRYVGEGEYVKCVLISNIPFTKEEDIVTAYGCSYVYIDSKAVADFFGGTIGEYLLTVDNEEITGGAEYCVWSSHDILNTTDNSIYLAASDPIPLDGMNVIEWDGVTEGLEVFDGSYYRIADFSKASSGVVVVSFVKDEDMRGVTSFFIDDLGVADAWAIAKDSDSDPNAYGISETASAEIGVSAGIYAVGALLEGSIVFWAGLLAYTPATTEPEEPEEPTERSLYSYNGTIFPNINTVWTDKTTYPYAVLPDNGHLLLLTKRPYYDSVNGRYRWPSESFTTSTFVHIGNGWKFELTNVDVSFPENISMATPLWLNVDWLTETGEVHQATTEPVYVGEADPVPEAESYYLYSVYFGSTFNVKHEIPALPYWDKEKYPYYLIAISNSFKKSYFEEFYEFVLAISTEPFYEKSTYYPATDVTENQILVPSQNTEVKLCWYRYDYPGFVWSPFILKEPVIENGTWKYTVKFFTSDVILSNVNILDSNGYIWAGLNQLLPVPTKLENFICGYIAGLSGGHTEFRDNTWPIQFDVNVVLRNKVQLAVKTPKISDIVMSESDIANLKVSVIKQDGMVYELVRDEDSEVVTFDYGYRSTYHSVDKSESVYVFSFHTSGDGDTVLSGPVPETGTYCMCSRDNSIIRIDK